MSKREKVAVSMSGNGARLWMPDGSNHVLTLEEVSELIGLIVKRMGLDQLADDAEDQMGRAIGSALWGMVKALRDNGRSVPHSLALASYMAIDGSLGRGATMDLGISDRAERRMRASIREALSGVDLPDDVPAEYIGGLVRAMAPLGAGGKPLSDA